MAQAKKKTATKTAKKPATRTQTRKKACTRTAKKQQAQNDKLHVYIVTAMAIIAGVLLCANAAMMMI